MPASASRAGAARRPVRRSHFHAAAGEPDRAAGAGAVIHAAGDRLAGAGLCTRSGPLCARRRSHAHHLSLSAVDHAGDALRRHPQCAAALRRRRRRLDLAQSLDDGDARRLPRFFPSAGHAAAWGVLISGVLQLLLVGGDAWRAGALPVLRWPQLDADVRQFFRALGPATVGSMGVQLALFADTIIASFLRGRRAVGALLRRPAQSAADRRHRHRRRHRDLAGNVAAHRHRR